MNILKEISDESVLFLLRKMWQYAKGHRFWVITYFFMATASYLTLLATPLVFGKFLNEIQLRGVGVYNINYLVLILFGLLGVELVSWAFHGPSRVIESVMAFRTERNYRKYLLSNVLDLNLSWHANHDSGDTIDKVNKASSSLQRFSSDTDDVIKVLVDVIGTSIILFFFNPYISLVTLLLLITAFVVISKFDQKLVPQYKKLNLFDNKISARIYDGLSNITSIKVLNIEKPILNGINSVLWAPLALFRKNKILVNAKWFFGSLLFTLIIVLPLLIYLLYRYQNNLIVEIGTIGTLYLYLSRLSNAYWSFTGMYQEMIIHRTHILSINELEEAFISNKKIRRNKTPSWKTIVLQNLYFEYEDTKQPALNFEDTPLKIIKGSSIALIGESGSGKSTFLKVLHGMYPTANATLTFDNKMELKTNFSNVALKTMLIPQEPEVFSSSIRENITLGLDYSDSEILKCTDLAEFTTVVNRLPNGLESVINERGVNLSGGQKQRLALSRALGFSSDKEIMLLDESTSSVDPENEVKIYKNIFKHFRGKTIIASIHKMNLLKYFDQIVVFDNGKILDQGTFNELLSKNEKFKKDWEDYITKQK